MKTEEVPTSKKKRMKVKVIVKFGEEEHVYEEEKNQPIGLVRNRFACELGLREEEFRFVTGASGHVLTDADILECIEDMENFDIEEEEAAEAAKAAAEAEAEAAKLAAAAAKDGETEVVTDTDVKTELETEAEAKVEVLDVGKLESKKEQGAEGVTPEDVAVDIGDDEAKVKKDSSGDEEKKRFLATEGDNILSKLLGFDKTERLIAEVCRRCVDAQCVDREFIHQQAQVIMRATRLVPLESEKDQKPQGMRLIVEVQEGFPLFMVTKFDGIKYMACLGHDTMKEVRDRFARLINCEAQHLVLRKHEEDEILSEDVDEMTMDDLEMENGSAFDAERTGLCKFNVIFDFVLCVQFRANLDKPVESLMKKIETRAPAFKGVRFYFWYNGNVIPDDTNEPLGKYILGCHFLRVMIQLDPTLPVDSDGDNGPDMIVIRPEPQPREPMFEEQEEYKNMSPRQKAERRMRLQEEAQQAMLAREEAEAARQEARARRNGSNGNDSNGSGDNKENEENGDNSPPTPDSGTKKKPELPLHIELNKRVLRYMTLLVECNLVENMRPDSPHHAPITLPRCLPNMTILDLKKKIFKASGEDPDDQTLFYNGLPIDLADNYTTLRELGILGENSLYMEPSINVYIDMTSVEGNEEDREPLKMRRGQKSTTINDVYEWVTYKRGLDPEEIHLEIKGVAAVPGVPFSDYSVEDDETFVLLRSFRLRVWHEQFLYDKTVWKHMSPLEFMTEVEHDTGIPANEQVYTFSDSRKKTKIALNKPSLYFCKIHKDEELEVWQKSDYTFYENQQKQFKKLEEEAPPGIGSGFLRVEPSDSPPLEGATGGAGFDREQYPHFLESHARSEDDDDDSDSEDDDDFEDDE